MALAPERPKIYEGSRIPSPIPTILQVPPELRDSEDLLEVNFGPNHPSTHGVLRLVVELHGEDVVGLRAVIGYLHTGFEKNMEAKSWWKAITYAPRIDYLSFQNNELVFVLAVEKLLELRGAGEGDLDADVPRRAEPDPLAPGLARHRRARAGGDLDVLVLLPRARPDPRPVRDGRPGRACTRATSRSAGSPRTSRRASSPRRASSCAWMPKAVDEYEALVDRNAIWLERTKGLGLLSAEDAIALGQSGPVLRASGVDWDLRKAQPYLAYDQVDFDVPVYENGDVWDRYNVHMDEMRESTRIVAQCLDRLEAMEGQPWIADDRKVVLPPREELHTSMESLIHHFKIVTEGFRVPEGEVYVTVESARGELGCYVVSDGGPKPWRVKFRAPSFVALEATATCMSRRARRRPDRDRRLARHASWARSTGEP